MSDSRGRRINRSVTIDVDSVSFCDRRTIDKLKEEEWWGDLDPEAQHVNLTLFRRYLEHYISRLPELKTNDNMIYMVRELAPRRRAFRWSYTSSPRLHRGSPTSCLQPLSRTMCWQQSTASACASIRLPQAAI